MATIKQALISVSDKSGVLEFAQGLNQLGITILSTGGTAKLLADNGVPCTEVADYTGFPEMLDGRVKTLQPKIHAGILARRDLPEHVATLEKHGIPTIDLMKKAFSHPAAYDSMISNYLTAIDSDGAKSAFPAQINFNFAKVQDMRYGENPHQSAAFYRDLNPVAGGIADYTQLQGKELSYNNVGDADAAWECVKTFEQPACVIVKHANPCGVAIADNALNAYKLAYATDTTSAFGGIIAFNRELDEATAAQVTANQFVEVIIVPSATEAALKVTAAKIGRASGRER